jgi:hypothetical protein
MMTNDGFCNILHCHTQYFYLLQFFSLWCGLIVAFALEFSLFCFLPMNVVSSQVKWSFSSCWESLHYIFKVLLQVFVMLSSGLGFDGGMYVVANCSEYPVACDMS